MTRRVITVLSVFLLTGLLCSTFSPARQPDRSSEVARAVLRHEKLLTAARVEIPASVYHLYLRELHAPERPEPDAPVPFIAEAGTYHLTVKDSPATLKAEVRLRVFDPKKCLNLPILGTKNIIWKGLTADNKGILTTTGGWVRFTAPRPGVYTISGRFSPAGAVRLNVIRTVRTAVVFDLSDAMEVRSGEQVFVGTAKKGTHGRFALKPTNKLRIKYTKPMPRRARPPRYSLQGDVAWNLGAGAQQVAASLKVTIAAGASDRVVLLLPHGADRVKITGPEVRKVQVGSGRAVVHLRGKILGSTVLKVSYELPAAGPNRRLDRFGIADGRWSGGTLVVTNSAGGSEILPATMTGLRRMSLSEVPSSASAILPAPAVMAYEITSRDFSAEVEVLRLGRFALRQSIVDLAHYEVFLARDGSVICRAQYEIRNSNKQFLRLKLPAGAQVLLARVNEKSRPLSPRTTGVPPVKKENTGETPVPHSEWLLPLERSRASVMGLVSFPAEVVYLCRTAPMGDAGVAEIPLPGIDLPIAYAWCETYVPTGLDVAKWSGVMKKVSRFTSETATASLDYGWGELAEGYTEKDRPTTPPTPKPSQKKIPIFTKDLKQHLKPFPKHLKPVPRPEPTPQPTTRPASRPSSQREMGVPSRPSTVSRLVGGRARVRDGYTGTGFIQLPEVIVTTRSATPILARNYYRTGKEYYDKNEFAEAARYLEQVSKLAPGSAEARNARRLLANPQMPKARELETKAEKAAARMVEREVAESNISLEHAQWAYIQSGKAAAREGRYKEATAKLKAAQATTEQLIARGAGRKETLARMQKAQPEMKQLRKQSARKIAELSDEMSKLKKSGKYEEALKAASELRRHSDELTAVYAYDKKDSRVAGLKRAERKKLQKEMDALAAAASRKRQRKGTKLTDARQSQVPWHTLTKYPEKWPDATARRKPKPTDMPTTAPARKPAGPITVVYDIRDLVVRTPDFKGPNINLRTSGNNNNAAGGWAWGDDDDDDEDDDSELSRQKSTDDLLKLIREAIAPDTWRGGGGGGGQDRSIREQGGQIIVTGSYEKQQALTDLLVQLRQARGPQVEEGKKIAQQKAAPRSGSYVAGVSGLSLDDVQIKDKELDEFLRRNYDWALRGDRKGKGRHTAGGRWVSSGELISKLRYNRSQKVVVNSLNVNADARAAAALGVRFNRGGNNVNWAVINEAQFRTLMELDAELTRRSGPAVEANERFQETIVGTDARLSNEMTANITFAGDMGNTLNISGNTINLAHEGYLLLSDGGHLTVVRADAMQHWRETPAGAGFVEVPQNIEVPRVGRLFRFERTLLEPSDQMVLRVEYKQKGVSK